MDRKDQIRQAHAGVIVQVVKTIEESALMESTEEILKASEQNGWNELVSVIRRILKGERSAELLNGLDEEDHVIAESILTGIQNPATLPDPNKKPDASMAAPGLAHMIHQAASGNTQALEIISHMAEQMSQAGGDMKNIAAIVRRMINGERDLNKLSKGMGTQSRQLVEQILQELHQLGGH